MFGVYALICAVHERIFRDYELIPNVYDLIFCDADGKNAGNDGICGVLNGENRRFAALKSQFFDKKCCLTGGLQA
jgi:hypothetical protein